MMGADSPDEGNCKHGNGENQNCQSCWREEVLDIEINVKVICVRKCVFLYVQPLALFTKKV